MRTLSHATGFSRFLQDYRRFLGSPLTLQDARDEIGLRMADREVRFLDTAASCIFQNPKSPYLPLLELAGCELGDLRNLVFEKGLNEALEILRQAGVFFSFEEFKGRAPVVREGREFPLDPRAFNNVRIRAFYGGQSGGSTGRATRVFVDLRHIAALAPAAMMYRHMHGLLDKPLGMWLGVLPDPTGSFNLLRQARWGQIPDVWFTSPISRQATWRHRLFTRSMVWFGRWFGSPIPAPEPIELGEELRVARWMAREQVPAGGGAFFSHPSKALRIAFAAREAGIKLDGVQFIVGGEPVTSGKIQGIVSSGASYQPLYAFSEHGTVGEACPKAEHEDEVHVNEDTLAVIQAEREIPAFGRTVGSFFFSSLTETAPKVLLNVESDDFGVLEERDCSCELGALGFRTLLRDIRSFGKLTAEGTTLVGTDLERILEVDLPARFGGGPLDYQLMEEEGKEGFTRLSLIVHPKIPIQSEREVIESFLEAAGNSTSILAAADAIRVKRVEPRLTGRGKFLPLSLMRG